MRICLKAKDCMKVTFELESQTEIDIVMRFLKSIESSIHSLD